MHIAQAALASAVMMLDVGVHVIISISSGLGYL